MRSSGRPPSEYRGAIDQIKSKAGDMYALYHILLTGSGTSLLERFCEHSPKSLNICFEWSRTRSIQMTKASRSFLK